MQFSCWAEKIFRTEQEQAWDQEWRSVKKYNLIEKKSQTVGARKIAGIGTRWCKLNTVHQILGKLTVLPPALKVGSIQRFITSV